MNSRAAAAVELIRTALAAVDRIDPAPRHTRKGMAQVARAIAGAKMKLHGTAASIAELEAALAMRRAGANAKTLRSKLRRVEEQLDE